MKKDNERIRNDIIFKLVYYPGSTFSELWDRRMESNKFAYHLKKLKEEKMVFKKNNRYYLTKKAKKCVDWISNKGEKIVYPPVCYLYLITNKNNQILVFQKLKEPFYGYHGLPAGRMRFGYKIIESAEEKIKREANLEVELRLIGVYNIRTFDSIKQPYHQMMFLLRGENPKGNLVTNITQGKLMWLDLNKISNLKLFPQNERFFSRVNKDEFEVAEIKNLEKDGEFVNSQIDEFLL
jgi:ADP-ribose pyrophosphatase YjhB (NUDIX family)